VRAPAHLARPIDGCQTGPPGRHLHLGYWDVAPPDTTPCRAEEFQAAQARLCDVILGLADLGDGQSVLDVGCGPGGTLAVIDARWHYLRLAGLELDRRQLDVCRKLVPHRTNSLMLVTADACAIPFRPASFDRLICREAMYQFRSRRDFLQQAADALRSGGRLALADILLAHPGHRAPVDAALLVQTIRRSYGPWPQPWCGLAELLEAACASGLVLERVIDATSQTLPSHRISAPGDQDARSPQPTAGSLMRWLHREGYLSYLCLAFTKA
jgi:MPBQ/MSBQ methyltransferase